MMNPSFFIFLSIFLPFIVQGTNVQLRNYCNYQIQVTETGQGYGPIWICTLGKGQTCAKSYGSANGLNFRDGYSASATQAELTINGAYSLDYYDISVINGFDVGMKIEVPGGDTLVCTDPGCRDAYHKPDDRQTHSAPTGNQFTITFCP